MSVLEKIKQDLKDAQKTNDLIKKETLRYILSEVHNYEISKRFANKKNFEIADDEIIKIIQREIKKRKEAKELFLKGKRLDLVHKTQGEIEILLSYVPPQVSASEVLEFIEKLKRQGIFDFNHLIKEVMKKFGARVDGGEAAKLIQESLK